MRNYFADSIKLKLTRGETLAILQILTLYLDDLAEDGGPTDDSVEALRSKIAKRFND